MPVLKRSAGANIPIIEHFQANSIAIQDVISLRFAVPFQRGNADAPRIYPSVKTLFFSSQVKFINFSHILGIRMKLWRWEGQCVYGSNRHLLLGAVLHIVCERAESESRLHIIRFG